MQAILGSEKAAIVGAVDPGSLTVATHATGWVSAADFGTYQALVQSGTMGSGGTIDAKLQQATDSSGSGAKDITGKAIAQITTDNQQETIDLRTDELDVNNGFAYIRLLVSVGTAASGGSALLLGLDPASAPASQWQASTVLENAR